MVIPKQNQLFRPTLRSPRPYFELLVKWCAWWVFNLSSQHRAWISQDPNNVTPSPKNHEVCKPLTTVALSQHGYFLLDVEQIMIYVLNFQEELRRVRKLKVWIHILPHWTYCQSKKQFHTVKCWCWEAKDIEEISIDLLTKARQKRKQHCHPTAVSSHLLSLLCEARNLVMRTDFDPEMKVYQLSSLMMEGAGKICEIRYSLPGFWT